MAPSNSLINSTYQNRALYNRADIRNLKVRDNLLINENNLENYTRDDALLVLITLYITNARLFSNKIEFTIDNLKLTEWDNRSLNSKKQYRNFIKYSKEEAKFILQSLFDIRYQRKYNAHDNPPNALLNTTQSFETEHYIIIKDLITINDNITLIFESEDNSPKIEEQKNINLRIVIDYVYKFTINEEGSFYDNANIAFLNDINSGTIEIYDKKNLTPEIIDDIKQSPYAYIVYTLDYDINSSMWKSRVTEIFNDVEFPIVLLERRLDDFYVLQYRENVNSVFIKDINKSIELKWFQNKEEGSGYYLYFGENIDAKLFLESGPSPLTIEFDYKT